MRQPVFRARTRHWLQTIARVVLVVAALLQGSASRTQGLQAEPFLVIVHPSNPVTTLPRAKLSALFLKQARTWDSGMEVVPVDQGERSHVRIHFSKAVHRRPARAVKAYWNQRVFVGRDTPPLEVMSDAQVVAFVAANRGAIGYVSPSVRLAGVKVLSTLHGDAR